MARLAVYALGGGLGHAVRMRALARVAVARGHTVHALVNASRLPDAALALPGLSLVRIPPDTPRAALQAQLAAVPEVDAWVVDTFPRGLLGELEPARLSGERIWIHRDLNPRYAERPEVSEAARAFGLVLVPGPEERAPLAAALGAQVTPPWLALDSADLLPREAARAALGAAPGRPLVVVSSAGTDAELPRWASRAAELAQALPEATVRLAEVPAHFPLLQYLAGVDVLVGAGGYHTVYEARAAGTPLLGLPQARTYDRQALRLRDGERVADPAQLPARIRSLLARPRAPAPAFNSGAHAALALIEAHLE